MLQERPSLESIDKLLGTNDKGKEGKESKEDKKNGAEEEKTGEESAESKTVESKVEEVAVTNGEKAVEA